MLTSIIFLLTCFGAQPIHSQNLTLIPGLNAFPVLSDTDKDGDPDCLKTSIHGNISVLWVDDDDDMKWDDLTGDLNDDCMVIDRNRDGIFGSEGDLVIDFVDENQDGKPDLQIIADNANFTDQGWTPGHFMITIDTDKDLIFNYIDWNTLKLEAWDHNGLCNFYQDYSGNSMFMKVHTSAFNVEDLRYNWENPFLFYDPDKDGLTEYAIRLMDQFQIDSLKSKPLSFTKNISDVRISWDVDNDNAPQNEFDYDLSLKFTGPGFNYSTYSHKYDHLKGITVSDSILFPCPWRSLEELIYVDHSNASQAVFNDGKWNTCWLVFDEDDDCQRWERVEFYEPLDLYRVGAGNMGLDNNPQADVTGDRGEWDSDNSGKGNLYFGKFDGKIHLFGAEWGAWRIDPGAKYFQGWQGWRNGGDTIPHVNSEKVPASIPVIKYTDRNANGFFDFIEFDLNGDKVFEDSLSLKELGIDDVCPITYTGTLSYNKLRDVINKETEKSWDAALAAVNAMEKYGISSGWLSFYLNPRTIQEKYQYSYFIKLSVYQSIRGLALQKGDKVLLGEIKRAFLGGDFSSI
jgi:hypothetical protein